MVYFEYKAYKSQELKSAPERDMKQSCTKKIIATTDTVGTFCPPTATHYPSERPLAIITASASQHSEEFDLPLFSNMGAGIYICSLNTSRMHGFKIRYKAENS